MRPTRRLRENIKLQFIVSKEEVTTLRCFFKDILEARFIAH
jgi:hypothetical protein